MGHLDRGLAPCSHLGTELRGRPAERARRGAPGPDAAHTHAGRSSAPSRRTTSGCFANFVLLSSLHLESGDTWSFTAPTSRGEGILGLHLGTPSRRLVFGVLGRTTPQGPPQGSESVRTAMAMLSDGLPFSTAKLLRVHRRASCAAGAQEVLGHWVLKLRPSWKSNLVEPRVSRIGEMTPSVLLCGSLWTSPNSAAGGGGGHCFHEVLSGSDLRAERR